ncbi:MAG: tetratricopeptide repeat protein [Gemmatimonadetes bacterium]|nr:tetratricopeptide repeat protein [Gemmatimonadota bacterium]
MTGRHSPRFATLTAVAAVMAATAFGAAQAQVQQNVSGRWRVLVPDFHHTEGGDKKFGERLADELRDLISELNTHVAVKEGDIKDDLKRFGLKMQDLDCVRARQLAQQGNYEVVLCAEYSGDKSAFTISAIQFIVVENGEAFDVDPIQSADKQQAAAAEQIVEVFALFVEQSRRAKFCADYAASQQWDSAMENCDIALDLNPDAVSVRYVRASVLRQLDQYEPALEEVARILEDAPFHENALLLGGYLAVQLDQKERARGYYREYLELDPTNASVRMNVAFGLATDGDPLGGMEIIEEGIELDSGNIDFYQQYGNFAFAAAEEIRREDPEAELGTELVELYHKAISAYERVFEERGEDAVVSQVRNVGAAYIQLGEFADAADFLHGALQVHGGEASLWAVYADALQKSDRIDDAIAALTALEEIDPDWRSLHLRMASWMIGSGRFEDAVPVLTKAVEHGSSPDAAAQMIYASAHSRYVAPSQKNYPRFVELIQLAKGFEVGETKRQELDFWHGFGLYNRGIAMQGPETVASANRSLPVFQEALRLFRRAKAYADRQPSIDYNTFVSATSTYIDIQEALIKRGR